MFVTAMESEASPLRARAHLTGATSAGGAWFDCGVVGDERVAIGVIGVGPVRSHRNAVAAIEQLAPSSVVMVGIAGGLAATLHVGDVTIPQQWSRYDSDTRWLGVDAALLASSRDLHPTLHSCDDATVCTSSPRVLVGGNGVSGARFVDDPAMGRDLVQRFDAVVTDMETAEVAHVAADHQVPFFAIRAVSDIVSTGRSDDLIEDYESLAAENAAATASVLP